MSAVMRLLAKQQQPAPHHHQAAHEDSHHPPDHSLALHLGPTSEKPAGLSLAPSLPYPQLPSTFSSPAPSSISGPPPYLLPKGSLSNPILKPVSNPQDPPLLANRTASDTPPLSHLTYLPANYAQKFKSLHSKPTHFEFVNPDRRSSPSHTVMNPSGHQTKASGDISHWDGRGLPVDTSTIEPPQAQQPTPQLPATQTPADKSPLSFFKRPIRMIREKKGPPAPLTVDVNPLSIKSNETIKLVPQMPNPRAHSDLSKPSTSPPALPLMQKAPSSSSTGSKLNSLLTAAARSIRTGDSRLLESFQSALSPRIVPESDKIPPPIPPWTRHQNPNSLKRKPVPAYQISEVVDKSPLSPRLTRATSLERPKTATKHSRTASLPHSQAPPALQHPTPLQHPRISRQAQEDDLSETIEKLAEVDEKLAEVDEKLGRVSPFASQRTQLAATPSAAQPAPIADDSNINPRAHPTLSRGGDSDYLDATSHSPDLSQHAPIEHPPSLNSELLVTGARSHRSPSTLSYEDFRGLVSRAMGSPLTVNHRIKYRNSYLSQRESQTSPLLPHHANDLTDVRHPDRDLFTEPVIGVNKRTSSFLQREPSLASIHEAKRKSFEVMPLPALPTPTSIAEVLTKPPDPIINTNDNQAAAMENIKKQSRPWTMAVPGSFSGMPVLTKLLPGFGRTLEEEGIVDGLTSPTRKSSLPQRKIRHSYPLRLTPNPSPLEQVSRGLRFPDPVSQTGKPLLFKFNTSGQIEYRENESSRLTPSLTPVPTNLMFGFRGEVYEVDKCDKAAEIRQSIKVPFDYDQEYAVKSLLDYQPLNPTRLSTGFVSEAQMADLGEREDKLPRSPGSDAQFEREVTITEKKGLSDRNVTTDFLPRIDLELDELAQPIELKEICLIGSGNDAKANFRASHLQRRITQEILIEPPSPRPSERNSSTEIALESLSIDRGSSEEESFRMQDESLPLEFGSEPKIINPETSLEMAASILGQPVPEVSKAIWKGFERLHSLTEARCMDSDGKELREVLGRLFEPGSHCTTPTIEASVQTDPVAFAPRNEHFVLQPPCIIRKSSTRRVADALKKLASKMEQTESLSMENLPLNLTRNSFQSERSFVSASRGSVSSLQDYNARSAQHDTPRTSAGGNKPAPWSERRQAGLNDMSEFKRFSSHRTPHSIHLSHFSSPLRQASAGESHLGLLSHSPLTTSPILTETVLDALDNALRAEETFQREKQHLQAVARRQSQTIESLLLDKEVLSLEVTRLTGLVELLTRDHNLLNERIDKAEEAFEKIPAASKNHPPASGCHSPDETACYCTATGDAVATKTAGRSLLPHLKRQEDAAGKEPRSFGTNGLLTETDDGVMGGDSDDSADEEGEDEDDRDSLCDPEQGSIIQHAIVLFTSPRSHPFTQTHSPIPGSYPLLPPVPAL